MHNRTLFTNLGTAWNLLYALFNGALAVLYRSWWFLTMSVYYLILCFMTAEVIRKNRQTDRSVRLCGIGMILLSIVTSGVVCLTIVESRNKEYHLIVMIAIATYTFALTAVSVIGAIRARKTGDLKTVTLRNISLVSAIGSVLSLQRSMLGTFSDAQDLFTITMEATTGAGAFLLIILIGLSTIRLSKHI